MFCERNEDNCKNRKLLVFIVLLISSAVSKGQIYKYIGLEDGLNNQKIYHIQKTDADICGFDSGGGRSL